MSDRSRWDPEMRAYQAAAEEIAAKFPPVLLRPASMSRAESASDQLYSPAATSGRICRRTAASPARSC